MESISGLEPSTVINEPRYLKLVTVKFLPIHFDLCVDATGVVCHQLGPLGTDLHAERLLRLCQDAQLNLPVLLLLLLSLQFVISKAEVIDCSASNADSAFMIF